MNNQIKIAIVALIVVLIGAYFVFKPKEAEVVTPQVVVPAPVDRDVEPEPVPEPEAEVEAPADPRPQEEPLIPPPEALDGSDAAVLLVINSISPKVAQWVVPEEQVRKWVLTVDMMADGKLPQRHKPLDFPIPTFAVESLSDDEFVSEDSNSQRITLLIDTITAVPPKTLARYYHSWLPLLDEAYGELGKKGGFELRFNQAIDRVLATDDIEDDVRLIQPHVFYQFEDKELEKKSALEKALWRMGDENREKLQAYLKELKFYL